MALEKRLSKVLPQLFTADGTANGRITINEACLFKVKQRVIVTADTLDDLLLEVKSVIDVTTLVVGPRGGSIYNVADVSAYTTALNASIEAKEQLRPAIPIQEIERFEYEEEPVVAKRTILVDKLGNLISGSNPLPVTSTENPVSGEIINIVLANANQEYSQVLPVGTVALLLKARNKAKLRVAYTAGGTSSLFYTISPGAVLPLYNINAVNTTLYILSTKPNTTVELMLWK